MIRVLALFAVVLALYLPAPPVMAAPTHATCGIASPRTCSRETAYTQCKAAEGASKGAGFTNAACNFFSGGGANGVYQCTYVSSGNSRACRTQYEPSDLGNNYFYWGPSECPAGQTWWDPVKKCLPACVAGQTSTAQTRTSSQPSTCNADSCTVAWARSGTPYVVVGSDGIPVEWQTWNGTSSGGLHCTAAPDADGDGTPDATDSEPNNPEESTDTDGDGIGDNNDAMPDDPTNGEDTGPGDETDNQSSGGGTCASPPVSTGDAIAANIAYQTWATRCAVEKLNAATTGNGNGPPSSGTDMTATNAKLDGIKTGTDNLAGEADLNEGSASGSIADIWSNETETPDFDMGGLGLSRSCPSPPTITLAGMSRTIDTSALCDLSEVIAALVLVMTAAHAAYIFAGRSA